MKIPSLTLAAAAAAALMSFTACDRSEPSAVNVESKPQSNSEQPGGASLGDGRALTQEEEVRLMAMLKDKPAVAAQPSSDPSAAAAPLAKTAAATCVVDFNQQAALAALPNHGANTAVTVYNHACYNNPNVYMMTTPHNLDHFHLGPENPATHCYAGGIYWGTKLANNSCVNPVDPMYWPRAASNMNSNSGIFFNAVANGYFRNFNIVAFYVRSGTVRLAAHVVGVGWRYYAPATAGQRWYLGATTTVDQAIFFDNNYNGVITIDNVEAQILY